MNHFNIFRQDFYQCVSPKSKYKCKYLLHIYWREECGNKATRLQGAKSSQFPVALYKYIIPLPSTFLFSIVKQNEVSTLLLLLLLQLSFLYIVLNNHLVPLEEQQQWMVLILKVCHNLLKCSKKGNLGQYVAQTN